MKALADDSIATFDALYDASPDPWGTTVHWYEVRKRALLLAALPKERYETIYEAGCGTGHISAALAERCDALLASDASERAVALAERTLAGRSNVAVECHRLPGDWPARRFDAIVLSELLYFLDDAQREVVAASAATSAADDGLVLACDWRAAIEGRGHTGDAAHRRFESALAMPRVFEYVDDDFVLTGWCRDRTSAAMRDGLR